MLKFQLSRSAESDIALMANYTIYKLGITQARKNRNGLLEVFGRLSVNPRLGRPFVVQGQAGLKRFRYESHMGFYKETGSGILSVRVLDGSMDFKRHL